MIYAIYAIHILVSLFLILVVLVQSGKGAPKDFQHMIVELLLGGALRHSAPRDPA